MQTTHYPEKDRLLDTILANHREELGVIAQNPEKYRLQVIYTRIDRDGHNRPHFRDYYFRVDSQAYFYPASTVKLAAAALALEKLHDLNIPGLDRNTPMFTDSLPGISPAVLADSSVASVGQYIKKILVVSDNDAFNRLYEFIGQEAFNKSLWEKGYTDVQVRHRVGVSGLTPENNRHTNGVTFRQKGRIIYQQPAAYSDLVFSPRKDSMGKGYFNDKNELIHAPMDASMKNKFPLADLHNILRSIIFPEAVTKRSRFRLNENDYNFLYHCMSLQPGESKDPSYDTTEFHRNYVKLLLFGGEPNGESDQGGILSDKGDIRIFNKPGWAYGVLTDVAYIADFTHQVEFMLSATVTVNEDGILNDEHYQFQETGKPFLKKLGMLIYQYELQRQRNQNPDLSHFKLYNQTF